MLNSKRNRAQRLHASALPLTEVGRVTGLSDEVVNRLISDGTLASFSAYGEAFVLWQAVHFLMDGVRDDR